jgi:hypothetical protein
MTLGLDYMKSSQPKYDVMLPKSDRVLVVHQQLDKLGLGACIWDCVRAFDGFVFDRIQCQTNQYCVVE